MSKVLLITPPFLQPNAPYPATPYLKSFVQKHGHTAIQMDLSIELLSVIFSKEFLVKAFDEYKSVYESAAGSDNETHYVYRLKSQYINTIELVMSFLRGSDPALANAICRGNLLPQGPRFQNAPPSDEDFGWAGIQDCAKYLCTLYLQDLSDFFRESVSPYFNIVKYAEQLAVSLPEFGPLRDELDKPLNIIESEMIGILRKSLTEHQPDVVAFTVPFPGNLLPALRCCQFIKANCPDIRTVIGGGYPSTELRSMSDDAIFDYVDFITLDDGETELVEILSHPERKPERHVSFPSHHISHLDRGCPDYSDLKRRLYFSLCEVNNPMHRLWSDGYWIKLMLAHGCYWAKCAFCDTSLDYINRFDTVPASVIVDWMEQLSHQTGSRCFHFVDEAAPPKLLRDIALELIRRNLNYVWWTNIRFEKSFSADLCQLLARAGCIAVSGGLEIASDRLLQLISKGISVEQAALTMRNFRDAGIMIHAYLMYGFPSQTLQETVDALEIVRQMFNAQLIDSAFWHRYAMTLHSPSACTYADYGVRSIQSAGNNFANNEIDFEYNFGYSLDMAGDALTLSMTNFLLANGLDKPVHKWFSRKVPSTSVDASLIEDIMLKPDSSRLFDPKARIVWVGGSVSKNNDGTITVFGTADSKTIKFQNTCDADFMVSAIARCGDPESVVTAEELRNIYSDFSEEPFSFLYHSKNWDRLRNFGLLQI